MKLPENPITLRRLNRRWTLVCITCTVFALGIGVFIGLMLSP